jgi:hypothetical protein
MTTPLSRLQVLVKESVPEAKQSDFNTLLGEFRHSVILDVVAEIAILTGEPTSRWNATELKQFSDHLRSHLLKTKEFKSCPIDSQPSEVEI